VNDAEALQLLDRLQKRPSMWLPSEHYAALVSFLEGINAASEGSFLRGFNEWLAAPRVSSWTWWGQIEHSITGADDGPGGVSDMFERLSPDESKRATRLSSMLYSGF
jgi:hypothetical protein